MLLAFALLAIWARLIVPLPGQAGSIVGDGTSADAICSPAGDPSVSGEAPATSGHGDRLCPLCRLAEDGPGLPPSPFAHAVDAGAMVVRTAEVTAAVLVRDFALRRLPRGPPEIAATL